MHYLIIYLKMIKMQAKKVRNDATYNKDYLTGRYGAIPVLEEFNIDYEKIIMFLEKID